MSQLQDNLTAQIYLRQTPVNALLDSGAGLSLIDYDLLLAILPNASQHMFNSPSKFDGITGVTEIQKTLKDVFTLI